MIVDFANVAVIIAALITGVVSPVTLQLVQHYLKKRSEKKKHTLDSNQAIQKDNLITSKLRAIMDKYQCDRVWIAEFHNGGKTYSGKSFQRFSITYEVVAHGVSNEALHSQNIPTSIFSHFFKQLEESTHILCKDINRAIKRKDCNICPAVQSFFTKRASKGFLCLQIRDIQNNFVGFLCLEGVINELHLTNEDVSLLVISSSNLAGYLEE